MPLDHAARAGFIHFVLDGMVSNTLISDIWVFEHFPLANKPPDGISNAYSIRRGRRLPPTSEVVEL
jgi:hypothetical protein